MIICKNCNNEFNGKFCNNCGQKVISHRLNFKFIIEELQHFFFHTDRGILFTIYQLLIHPGHTVREYIEGKRINHTKPLVFLLVVGSIELFLYSLFKFDFNINYELFFQNIDKNYVQEMRQMMVSFSKFTDILMSYDKYLNLGLLPFLAMYTYLLFKKYGLNYVEHFVINTYLLGQRLLISCAFFPVMYLYNGTNVIFLISFFSMFLMMVLFCWSFRQYFIKEKALIIIKKSIVAFGLSWLTLSLCAGIVAFLLYILGFLQFPSLDAVHY